ncbi:MAG: hypothetical protein NUV54_00550, partial [Candidatus Taylorbacteria bacterium]|nr:hypothetical protein [Candidatus Taylorbacteria bacterium]
DVDPEHLLKHSLWFGTYCRSDLNRTLDRERFGKMLFQSRRGSGTWKDRGIVPFFEKIKMRITDKMQKRVRKLNCRYVRTLLPSSYILFYNWDERNLDFLSIIRLIKNMKKKNILTVATLSLFLVASSASIASAQSDKGGEVSEQHKSSVANVVEDLTSLAGKSQNIGEEVSAVAKEQESSNERATEAIKVIEERGGFKTFLFGTDYKNIGALRSEVVTTQNSVERLTKAMDRVTDDSVKTDLDTQIKALEEANTNALNFIQTNESKFSLFGWFMKLFQ